MEKTFFSVLEFENKLREKEVILSLSDSNKTQSLNSYNSFIESQKFFSLLQELNLTDDELNYLQNYYYQSCYFQSQLLGTLIEVWMLLHKKR